MVHSVCTSMKETGTDFQNSALRIFGEFLKFYVSSGVVCLVAMSVTLLLVQNIIGKSRLQPSSWNLQNRWPVDLDLYELAIPYTDGRMKFSVPVGLSHVFFLNLCI